MLEITPDDPRWIGAWWGGFLLCGALLFFSAIFMFGFPQSLAVARPESDRAMLPDGLSPDYDHTKPSNGTLPMHEPGAGVSCCEHLKGERSRGGHAEVTSESHGEY